MVKQEKNKYLTQPKLSTVSFLPGTMYSAQYVDYTAVTAGCTRQGGIIKHWYTHTSSKVRSSQLSGI